MVETTLTPAESSRACAHTNTHAYTVAVEITSILCSRFKTTLPSCGKKGRGVRKKTSTMFSSRCLREEMRA